jgi:hypothetical protein
MLDQVHSLVRARSSDESAPRSPCLFVVNGLEHARDLEVGADSKAVDHDLGLLARLEQIVRDGPIVGVHTLLWAQHRETLDERLSRGIVRSFGVRVVGAMDAAASTALIETGAASDLRPNQALLYDEFRSRMVKFRPYAVPKAAWAATAAPNVTTSA